LSLIELLDLIREIHGKTPPLLSGEWRPGDQKYYVTDFGKFKKATGWRPRIGPREGITALYRWLSEYHPSPFFLKRDRRVQ
jgi:CDP-paratose 2-epimerase